MKTQARAQSIIAGSQRIVDKVASGGVVDPREAASASNSIDYFQGQLLGSTNRQTSAQSGAVSTKLRDESGIGGSASAEYIKNLSQQNKLIREGATGTEDYKRAVANVQRYHSASIESLDRQKNLVREKLSIEVQGQQKVQDLLKSQLDLTTQKLQRSQDEQSSAIGNFAKLGQIEKQQAIDALNQGRKKGGASLDDSQKDLLRSVGTREATRLANEGDIAEARQFGFNDQTFESGFAKEQAGLSVAKQRIEADLSTSYDVSVKLTTDTSKVVDSVASKVEGLMRRQQQDFTQGVEDRLTSSLKDLLQQVNLQLRSQKR